jgi:hypothetical protein
VTRRSVAIGLGIIVLLAAFIVAFVYSMFGYTGDKNSPARLFVRAEGDKFVGYEAHCSKTNAARGMPTDVTLLRLDFHRAADGRVDDIATVELWRAVADPAASVLSTDRVEMFEPPAGMRNGPTKAAEITDIAATYRFLIAGRNFINAASFVPAELRSHPGEFDVVGRRFTAFAEVVTFACSKEFETLTAG